MEKSVVSIIIILSAVLVLGCIGYEERIRQKTEEELQKGLEASQRDLNSKISIESINGNLVIVRNIGEYDINSSSLAVFSASGYELCKWNKVALEKNSTITCELNYPCINGIVVSGPSNWDTADCNGNKPGPCKVTKTNGQRQINC